MRYSVIVFVVAVGFAYALLHSRCTPEDRGSGITIGGMLVAGCPR